jgi:hypothetical protein
VKMKPLGSRKEAGLTFVTARIPAVQKKCLDLAPKHFHRKNDRKKGRGQHLQNVTPAARIYVCRKTK